MATCLNINDPQVQSTLIYFGEVATSKILEVYNEKYSTRKLDFDLASSIYNQILLDKRSYVHPVVGTQRKSIDRMQKEIESTDDFYNKLRTLLNNTNWKALRDLAKKAEVKGVSIAGVDALFDQLSSETDLKNIAEAILSYIYENTRYVNQLQKALYAHLADESIPEKERGKTGYFASQLAQQIQDNMQDWKLYFPELLKEESDNFIKKNFDNINTIVGNIKDTVRDFSAPRIAEELANEIAMQTAELAEKNKAEIQKLQKEKERLQRLQAQGATLNRTRIIRDLEKAIKRLELRASQYATKENIVRILTGDFNNQDNINWLSYWAESAQLTSNIITAAAGNLIWGMQVAADQRSQRFQSRMAKLGQRAVEHFKSKGNVFLSSLNEDALFDTYVREVDVVFVNKDGNLETRKALALQSKMDEIGYKNEKVKMEHAIAQKKLNGEDTFEDEEKLARFVEANEDRGLTEEYYRIMSSLSPKAKKARKKIIEKMKLLETRDKTDIINTLVFEQMQDLRFQLERLESFVYPDGSPKVGDDLEIAEDIKKWKEETRAAQLFVYELEPENLEQWKTAFEENKNKVKEAEDSYKELAALYEKGETTAGTVAEAKKKLYLAKRDLDLWAKSNVRRTISPDWYAYRRKILDAISEIQAQYQEAFAEQNLDLRTASEIWDEIFNVLKGYRDSDGIYVGTDIPLDISNKVKNLQEELKKNMDQYKKAKLVSEEDKEDLQDLFSQLNDIQTRQETTYYKAAYENALSQTRAQVVAEYMRLNPDLVLNYEDYLKEATKDAQEKNPNLTALEIGEIAAKSALNTLYEKESLLNTRAIDQEIMVAFKKSAWFKANHTQVEKYDPISRRKIKTFEPLYFWNEILPWDSTNEVVDERYINRNTPSFRWFTYKINDQVLDPQTGKPLFVNPDYKYIPGRVQLRPSSQFVNDSYDKLDATEKEILAELDEMYQGTQSDLPSSLRRGLLLPSVRKDKFTNLGKSLNPLEHIKLAYSDIRDKVLGDNEEDEDGLKGQKTSSRVHRKLYLKYSSNMEIGLQSKNVFASLAMFNHEAERFKEALKNSPTLFGLEDILSDKRIGDKPLKSEKPLTEVPQEEVETEDKKEKSFKERAKDLFEKNKVKDWYKNKERTIKMVQNLYETHLFGQGSKDPAVLRAIGATIIDPTLSISRKLTLNYNVPSSIKNFLGNLHNTMIQANEFDLKPSDIWAGMAEGATHINQLFLADRNVRVGRESDYVKMLDYFHVFPKQHAEQLRNIINNPLRETAAHSPLSILRFGRTFFEMEVTLGVYEALMQKQILKNKAGEQKILRDAYEVVDGEIRIKSDFDEAEVKALESYFIKKLHAISALINGAYAKIDQAELKRFVFGRFMLHMKGWLAYQAIRRYGKRRIMYGGGFEFEGFFDAFLRESFNFLGAVTRGKEGIQAYMLTVDKVTRNALRGALYDTLGIIVGAAIAYAVSGLIKNDGDDEDNYGIYFLLYNLAYLLDEIETLHPIAGPTSMVYGRVTEQSTQDDASDYYIRKNFYLPFLSVYDVLREGKVFATESTYNLFDDYAPRDSQGRRTRRKDIPSNPALEGHSNIVAEFLRQSKLATSYNYFRNPEFQYRTWTHYNPKWFLQSTKEELEDVRSDINEIKRNIEALNLEIENAIDPQYRAELQILLLEKQKEVSSSLEQQMQLDYQLEDNVIQ